MNDNDALLRFRAEFADVKSLADVPRLSPERLKRFKQQLDELDDPPKAPERGLNYFNKEKTTMSNKGHPAKNKAGKTLSAKKPTEHDAFNTAGVPLADRLRLWEERDGVKAEASPPRYGDKVK
jgi:hypothetical protein